MTPQRSPSSCCLNCRPPHATCTRTQYSDCLIAYASLRSCLPGEDPKFNSTTCCVSCKVDDRTLLNVTCTAAAVDSHLLSRPVCDVNEPPVFNRNVSCVAHCRRPQRLCQRSEMLQCSAHAPNCVDGADPPVIPDECCPVCRKIEPHCNPPCNVFEKCLYNITTGVNYCVPPRKVYAVIVNFNTTYSTACSDARTIVRDGIDRFCDNADNAGRCVALQNRVSSLIARECIALSSGAKGLGVLDAIAVDFETYEGSLDSGKQEQLDQLLADIMTYSFVNDTDHLALHTVTAEKIRVSCMYLADRIPQCDVGETSNYDRDTGCMSCRPAQGRVMNCTCPLNVSTIRNCSLNEVPVRDPASCCPTCIRNEPFHLCTDAQLDICKGHIASGQIAMCDLGESPMFNTSTCCLSCAPRNATDPEKPSGGNRNNCSNEEIVACMSKIPICADDEQPVQLSDRCCSSCRFPERGCAVSDVARCVATIRKCRVNEVPAHLEGDCCPTCLPDFPTCAPACSSEQYCDNNNGTSVCRNIATTIRMVLRRVNDSQPIDCSAAVFAYSEILRRGCDGPYTNISICTIARRLAESIRQLDCVRDNDNTFVSADIPAIPEISGYSVSNLVQDFLTQSLIGDSSQTYNIANDERTCTLDILSFPRCAFGEKPVYDRATRCYSCRSSYGRPMCADNATALCLKSTPRVCNKGERPAVNETTCCSTCRLEEPLCTLDQIRDCTGNYSSLPLCPLGSFPHFDHGSCCANCRRDPILEEGRPPGAGEACPQAQFDSCIARTPICHIDETPSRSPVLCCPSCKRPERQCSLVDVVSCRANVRLCAYGELPTIVDGDCCPSCRPAPGNCSMPCNTSNQVCVPNKSGNYTCRYPGPSVGITLTSGVDKLPNCSNVLDLLHEIVMRFCEKNDNATL